MASKPESPITLVVRRGALRRFNKLQKDTKDLPVVVTWDRRASERQPEEGTDTSSSFEERRKQPSFTWELADFLVVPGDVSVDEVDDETQGAQTAEPKGAKRR